MKLGTTLSVTALAVTLGAAVIPASAQSVTVTEVTGFSSPYFSYSYTVTPSFNTYVEAFLFSDPNVSTSPGGLKASTFTFTDQILAGMPDTFTFYSTDGKGGSASTSELGFTFTPPASITAVSASASGLPGPLASPEPGSMVSLSVLGACLGLGIVARRRKSLAN